VLHQTVLRDSSAERWLLLTLKITLDTGTTVTAMEKYYLSSLYFCITGLQNTIQDHSVRKHLHIMLNINFCQNKQTKNSTNRSLQTIIQRTLFSCFPLSVLYSVANVRLLMALIQAFSTGDILTYHRTKEVQLITSMMAFSH